MATRQDRVLWSALWSPKSRAKITPTQFKGALDSGASPWTCYVVQGGQVRSILESICSGDRADFRVMRSCWINKVGSLGSSPSSHPRILHCLPLTVCLSAIEELISAGAGPVNEGDVSIFLQRGLKDNDCLSSSNFWGAIKDLLGRCQVSISQIPLPGHPTKNERLMAIFECGAGEIHEDGLEVLFSESDWDLSWKESGPYGEFVSKMLIHALRRAPHIAPLLDQAGLNWGGVDYQGNTLAHLLVSKTVFSYDGKEILPVEALRYCLEKGVDFDCENSHGWTVSQRINAINWSNESNLEPLFSDLRRIRLSRSTIENAGQPVSSRRL